MHRVLFMRRSVYRKAEAGGRCQPVCMECVCVYGEHIHINSFDRTCAFGNLERMARRVILGQRRVQRSKGVI